MGSLSNTVHVLVSSDEMFGTITVRVHVINVEFGMKPVVS
jgi:hypothetical protein